MTLDTLKFNAPKGYGTIQPGGLFWAGGPYLVSVNCDGKGFIRADILTGIVELHMAIGYNLGQDALDFPFPPESGAYVAGDHNQTVYGIGSSVTGDLLIIPGPFALLNPDHTPIFPDDTATLRFSNPVGAASVFIGPSPEVAGSLPVATGWTLSAGAGPRDFVISGPGAPPPPPVPPPAPTPAPPPVPPPTPPPGPAPAPCTDAGFPYGKPGPFGKCYNCANEVVGQQDKDGVCVPLGFGTPEPPPPVPAPPPVAPSTTLRLLGRFDVKATSGGFGKDAYAVGMTETTGYFWFFEPGNVELLVKILDAGAGNFWVFIAGLTNVNTRIIVTDSVGGKTKTYTSEAGVPFAPIQDTSTFKDN